MDKRNAARGVCACAVQCVSCAQGGKSAAFARVKAANQMHAPVLTRGSGKQGSQEEKHKTKPGAQSING
eukprot:m.71033 g.71033  ORF g.71033 m.71033 type:complete len:69 (+) comp50162_c0_seq2:1758-1964(+)